MSDILREPMEADVAAVTRLVHAAYAEHSDVGLNFTATDQSEAVTRYRLFAGQSWVIDRGGEVVATATVSLPHPASGRSTRMGASSSGRPSVG